VQSTAQSREEWQNGKGAEGTCPFDWEWSGRARLKEACEQWLHGGCENRSCSPPTTRSITWETTATMFWIHLLLLWEAVLRAASCQWLTPVGDVGLLCQLAVSSGTPWGFCWNFLRPHSIEDAVTLPFLLPSWSAVHLIPHHLPLHLHLFIKTLHLARFTPHKPQRLHLRGQGLTQIWRKPDSEPWDWGIWFYFTFWQMGLWMFQENWPKTGGQGQGRRTRVLLAQPMTHSIGRNKSKGQWCWLERRGNGLSSLLSLSLSMGVAG
jgi:hypothetical protein